MKAGAIEKLIDSSCEKVYRNLSPKKLVDISLSRGEGTLAGNGALVTRTGERSGRSPKDRYIVEEKWSKENIWWGDINRVVSSEVFDALLEEAIDYLSERERFIFEGFVGADSNYRMPLRVIQKRRGMRFSLQRFS